jgi:2-methylcitrate dehydratase PrpD
VSLELEDGRSYSIRVDQALGHPDKPLSDAQLCAKFIECAGKAKLPWGEQQARAACEQLMQLERLERSVEVLGGGGAEGAGGALRA